MTSQITRRMAMAYGGGAALLLGSGALPASVRKADRTALLAPTPPMGWNSWNSFATTINEAQARENAAIMRDQLLPFGYDIFTIDIQWYEPGATGYLYSEKPVPTMDGVVSPSI